MNNISSTDIKVGLLTCPSLYKPIKKIHPNGIVRLFEYDDRFAIFNEDFIHYDYKKVYTISNYLKEFENYFDVIIADPPFLSEECIQGTATIIKRIQKKDAKIILCSGHIVTDWAKSSLNLTKCMYQPQHERNLANEFCSFANFNLDEMIQ